MASDFGTKINRLLQEWPHGTVATQSWLTSQGISQQLAFEYCNSGWLVRVGHHAYRRSDDPKVSWEGGVYALQAQLNLHVHIAAKTALELQGFAHFLPIQQMNVILFATHATKLPSWFRNQSWGPHLHFVTSNLFKKTKEGITPYAMNDFNLQIASPERAMMETLYLIPERQSLDESRQLMEGMTTLRPKLVTQLLYVCQSVKVKRLFMLLAEECNHSWLTKVDTSRINFGSGKRVIAGGGKFNKKYSLSVPFMSE